MNKNAEQLIKDMSVKIVRYRPLYKISKEIAKSDENFNNYHMCLAKSIEYKLDDKIIDKNFPKITKFYNILSDIRETQDHKGILVESINDIGKCLEYDTANTTLNFEEQMIEELKLTLQYLNQQQNIHENKRTITKKPNTLIIALQSSNVDSVTNPYDPKETRGLSDDDVNFWIQHFSGAQPTG